MMMATGRHFLDVEFRGMFCGRSGLLRWRGRFDQQRGCRHRLDRRPLPLLPCGRSADVCAERQEASPETIGSDTDQGRLYQIKCPSRQTNSVSQRRGAARYRHTGDAPPRLVDVDLRSRDRTFEKRPTILDAAFVRRFRQQCVVGSLLRGFNECESLQASLAFGTCCGNRCLLCLATRHDPLRCRNETVGFAGHVQASMVMAST